MLLNTAPTLRHATSADWTAIEALLVANKLPTDGAQAHLNNSLLAISNGEIVGCAGAEVYSQVALLRSVAVNRPRGWLGKGPQMTDREMDRRGMSRVCIP